MPLSAPPQTSLDLSVALGPLALKNPVIAASGPFGYAVQGSRVCDPRTFGAVTLKGIASTPWAGNAPRRWSATPAGMLNAVGLENIGVERFLTDCGPICEALAAGGTQPIANVVGKGAEEYWRVVERLETCPHVSAYELNVSCPNVKGGTSIGAEAHALADLVHGARARTRRPLIVKMAPQVTDIAAMAKVAEDNGADALTLINCVPGMAIDPETRRPFLSPVTGGLSGPAIKPIALRAVWLSAKVVSIPIIGLGGISSGTDAVEFLLAGATAVGLGAALVADPAAGARVLRELEAYCDRHGVKAVRELTGAMELS